MNINQKIEEIILVCKSGVAKNIIDSKGKGNAVRRLIKDPSSVTEKKINEMYLSILPYKSGELQVKKAKSVHLDLKKNTSYDEKKRSILDAISAGIAMFRIDIQGHGGAAQRLKDGKGVRLSTINRMYDTLMDINKSSSYKRSSDSNLIFTPNQSEKKILSLENKVNTMTKEISALKDELDRVRKKSLRIKEKKKSRKVMGITVLIKTDIIKKRAYKRWYGIYNDNGKRRWIYIGVDLAKAKDKIQNWFKTHSTGVK